MNNDFVTVLTSSFVAEAESVRMLLASEGIDAVIADGNIVNANWLLGPAVGFIKVQVPKSQEAAAMAILRKHPAAEGGGVTADTPVTCLACGAPLPEDATTCSKCGWTFEVRPGDESEEESGASPAAPPSM